MLKRALKPAPFPPAFSTSEGRLEAANAQTGIETESPSSGAPRKGGELEAANAQTGIETLRSLWNLYAMSLIVRSSECSNGH